MILVKKSSENRFDKEIRMKFNSHWVNSRKDLLHFVEENEKQSEADNSSKCEILSNENNKQQEESPTPMVKSIFSLSRKEKKEEDPSGQFFFYAG